MSGRRLNERTKDHYDQLIPRLTQDYIDHRWRAGPVQQSHYRQTRRAIRQAFEEAGEFGRILEIGPGPGTWTDLCLSHSRSVTICDISHEMLRKARERLGDAVEYVEGDFTSPATTLHGRFDALVSFRALEYMDSKARFLQRAREHLNPGGMLMLITKNPAWRDKIRSQQTEKIHRQEEIHRHWIARAELAEMGRAAGFESIEVRAAAVGSYHKPFNNRIGAALCGLWHRFIASRPMRDSWDPLVESYLLIGRKGGTD